MGKLPFDGEPGQVDTQLFARLMAAEAATSLFYVLKYGKIAPKRVKFLAQFYPEGQFKF